jgi:transcriptional regulator with XRE-family HTH domain
VLQRPQNTPPQLHRLELRRRALGMSRAALARASGVSLPTVQRILSGRHPNASWANIDALSRTLGMSINLHPVASARHFRATQAQRKAGNLVRMVQGSSALEGQALDRRHLAHMRRKTTRELLAGSNRRLWAE